MSEQIHKKQRAFELQIRIVVDAEDTGELWNRLHNQGLIALLKKLDCDSNPHIETVGEFEIPTV